MATTGKSYAAYLARLESVVGTVKRGQLCDGFEPDHKSVVVKDGPMVDYTRAARAVVPPLQMDLTHLNPKLTAHAQKAARASADARFKRRKR